ncbi:G patch domain-containing protein 4 [Danio aesculapii]|uniref:G patch domain-containing protein 4 n=1 Tax=Danio aesculapii TaxID=1142201 RepID=UPI0024C07557|nr:G patch domain-containing protein 4 [Danio aesculapii]
MAEMVQEKSSGLKFAEEQLLRHGWEKGKGLGRAENGISEAIKVKVKCDKGGMGHKQGEQFSFHWWDHVFNKASSGLVVESGQNGVMMKKSDDSGDGLISNKKPRKAHQAKSMLYGCFVKSATLLSGEEQPEKTSDAEDDSSSSSEDEDQKLDLSTTTKLSDADLLKACGGRTAHKGARHGLTMSAKLARLEQQEQEFINKYGKKKHTAEASTTNTEYLNTERHPDGKEKAKRKKSKKKEEPSENNIHDTIEDDKPKKSKDSGAAFLSDDMTENTKQKKRKRKEKPPQDCPNDCGEDVNEKFEHTSEESEKLVPINDIMEKKKKKKRSKVASEIPEEVIEDHVEAHGEPPQEGSTEHQHTSELVSKKKKKRKSEVSPSIDNSVDGTEDTNNEALIMDAQENNRKKNKKKKRDKNEELDNVEDANEAVPKKKSKE